MVVSNVDITDVACAGQPTGAVAITASGGVGGFTYAWSNGGNTDAIAGLLAGDYTVTVTSGSCTVVETYTVNEPANAFAAGIDNANTQEIDCFGGTATAAVTASGGSMPYTYEWSTGANGVTSISGLAPGIYEVTVSDNSGGACPPQEFGFTFTEPGLLSASVTNVIDVTCNGDSDGQVTVSISGGTAPYVWGEPLLAPGSANPVTGSSFTVTVSAGQYAFQVQDANGCGPSTVNVTVVEPDAISVTATDINNVTCNGNADGSIDVTLSGGAGGYTYTWVQGGTSIFGGGGSQASIGGLEGGSYDLTVTDANGCEAFFTYNVIEPTSLSGSGTVTNILCAGDNNGSIDLTVTDGTPPYTFSWNNGATTEDISGLSAGTYDVFVEDANGCVTFGNLFFTVTEPTALTVVATVNGQDVTCNGGSDGAIDLDVSGGTMPYSYMWNTGDMTEDLSGLTAGLYNVVVTDANGCTAPLAVSISEPDAITISGGATDISCAGAGDGSIAVTISGGTPGYNYVWLESGTAFDGGNFPITSQTGLDAGSYELSVTDNNGCQESFFFTINDPAPIAVSVTPTAPDCPGDFGAATASVSGGTMPYTYLWSTGAISATETGLLAAGSPYSVTVTDANGCTGVGSVTIVDPSPVTVSVDATDISCFGAADGSAVASASGGAGGYTYTWSNTQSGANISGLTAGAYSVTAMDANGCSATASITITEPAELTVVVNSVTDAPCFGENGTVVLDVDGGTQFTGAPGEPANPNGYPYIYTWSGGTTTIMDHIADGVPAGNYTVMVTDRNGCTAMTTVSVGEPALLEATATGTNPSCGGAADGTASVAATGGTMPYSYAWSNGMTMQNIAGLAGGTYDVTVTDANGCTATSSVTLMDPDPVAIASADIKNSCNPGTDGAVTLNVTGGDGNYTYLWSDGQTSNPATGLAAGSYSVTVNDGNGCGPATGNYVITQPAAPLEVANFNRTDVTCAGGMDGEIDNGGTTGGTPPYTYLWSNAATTPDISNLGAGNYSVTVTDAVGCTVVYLNIIINEPAAIVITNDPANKTDLDCFGDTDAFISVTASGGTGMLSYSWSNGVNGQSISGVPGGVYTVNVTDANGCVESVSYTVTEPAAITVTGTTTDPSCAAGSGSVDLVVSGGTPNYSYVWSNGDAGSTAGPITLVAGNGTYGLTVTDANGCEYTNSYTLTAPASIAITETITPTSCNSGSDTYSPDGSVSVSVTGGTAPYVYSWNGGMTTTSNSLSGLAAGATVSVVVTDANGCSATESYNVGEAPAVTVIDDIVNNTACAKGTAGEIHITASGGTGALSYAWEGPNGPVAGTTDLLNLVSGNYSLTITDANGCEFDFPFFVADGTDPATVALTLGNVTCNGANDGSIEIDVTSGNGPYIVVTTDGAGATVDSTFLTAPFAPIVINSLAPGSYSIAVIDQNGCPAAGATASITEPTKLVTSVVSTTDASCFGLADGSFVFNIDQGTQPYDMVWSNGTTAGSGMLTGLSDNTFPGTAWEGTIGGLAAGTYDITVTDAQGCKEFDQAVIGQPSDLTITFTGKDDIDCFGDTTGSAVANISGGSGVYTYQWYAGQYPGPITPLAGQSGMVVNGMANAVNLGVGFYTIEVDDLVGGCTYYAVFEETGPAPIVVDLVSDASVTCNGGTDATASVTISGGVAPYAWVVSGATNASGSIATDGGSNTFTGLGAGTYFVDVTDANGCTVPQASFTITEPAGLTVVTAADSILCPGGFNATASVVSVTGGIPPYSYLWSTGGTGMSTGVNVDGNPLFAGTYTVAITDATGQCATTVSVDVYEPMPVGGTAVVTDVACAGDCSTSLIDLTPTGGTAPYTYYWRASVNGVPTGPVLSTVQDPAGLCAGEYTVRINDKYGCEGFATFTIGTATTLVVTGVDTDVLCKGDATGAIDLSVTGGTAPYMYDWTNGATTEDISGLAAGSYSVVVEDANGCTTVQSFVITEPFSSLYASVIGFTDVSCNGGMDGTADIYVVGGTLPYSYMWSNGSMVQDPTDLMAGVNSVTITDANGCQEFLSVTISEPASALASGVESVTNIDVTERQLSDRHQRIRRNISIHVCMDER
ncbi:SprB repeat-containing protein [Cryomorphaceae bacterium]|nr:SprB repeat-containing protein [Cryomorphaceae bacterium]